MALFDIVLGNLLTVVILGVLYLSYQIFASYLLVCLYALLLSEAMQRPKQILIGITRGLLGHSVSTGLLMLSVVGCLTAGIVVMLTLSIKDLIASVQALQARLQSSLTRDTLQSLGMNASTLEALGVPQMLDSTMAYAQQEYTIMEAQYNTTPWWPMIADAISAVQPLENATNTSMLSVDTALIPGMLDLRLTALSDAASKTWNSIMTMDARIQDLLWGVLQKRQQELMKALMYVVQMGEVSLSFLQLFTSSLVNLVFFLSLTLSLLSMEKSVLHELVHGLCGSAGPRVEKQLRHVSEGVFFFPVAFYLGRYFYTLVVGLALQLEFPFLLALLTLLLTLIPGVSPYPWIASIPWVVKLAVLGYFEIGLALGEEPNPNRGAEVWLFGKALLLLLSQWQVLSVLEVTAAQRSFSRTPSWVTGLSVVCGFERFGLHAFFIAPLLVSLVILSFHLISEAREEDDTEGSKGIAAQGAKAKHSRSPDDSPISAEGASGAKKLGTHIYTRMRSASSIGLAS